MKYFQTNTCRMTTINTETGSSPSLLCNFEQTLINCKKTIKIWELKFAKQEGRPPTKDDFKLGPREVLDAYKLYYQIKRKLDKKTKELFPREELKSQVIEAKPAEPLPASWGQHLNKINLQENFACGENRDDPPSHGYWNISSKLMQGAKISTRSRLSRKPSKVLQPAVKTPPTNVTPERRETTNDDSSRASLKENEQIPDDFDLDAIFPTPKYVTNKTQPVLDPSVDEVFMKTKSVFRNIDTTFLDECTQHTKIPEDFHDDDVIYPSDEEETLQRSRINVKRKSEHSNLAEQNKKPRTESPVPVCESSDVSMPTQREVVEPARTNQTTKEKKENRLVKKMQSGTGSENFVRINLKKKVFARGKKQKTGAQYKRQQWKLRQKGEATKPEDGRGGSKLVTCKRCGDVGHYAKNCLGKKKLPPQEDSGLGDVNHSDDDQSQDENVPSPDADDEEPQNAATVEPLFKLKDDGSLPRTPDSVFHMLQKFGYDQFRPGQETAVMRILTGQSTLIVQSTGAGKSLCYQLPAALYAQRSPCVTIVISPLVSLMEDQVANLPLCLKAGCLHTSQAEGQRQKVLQGLQESKIQILFLSPESVISSGPYGLYALLKILPPVAFVCVDEAHCVSQWSYNFRPAYLRVCKILREKLKINTILGLTATVKKSSISNISEHLGLSQNPDSVIFGKILPSNLVLSVSRDRERDAALLELLQGERFSRSGSIIIYCTRREECDRLAALLRTSLKDPSKDVENRNKRGAVSWCAESYHAGLTAARRTSIQKHFIAGKLRIVVATVAFGMGINKSDIRGVIHFNAPRNFESYVQEIGRAGRDGQMANCHVFLNSDATDVNELRRFIYANSTDRHVLRKLLHRLLPSSCKCRTGHCLGHEATIPIESTVKELDLPEENIATLLCHLEAHSSRCVLEVGTPVYSTCTVRSYCGPEQLDAAAGRSPVLSAALKLSKHGKSLTFPVIPVAEDVGCSSAAAKRQLKKLEWEALPGGRWKKTGIVVEFSELSFHVTVRGDLNNGERDSVLEYLHERCVQRERSELTQLKQVFQAFSSVSYSSSSSCLDRVDEEKSLKLHSFVSEYFESCDSATAAVVEETPICDDSQVRRDIRHLVTSFKEQSFTGRAVARIFHGISSPCFPAEFWGRQRRYWRAHLDKDFNALTKIALEEILALK